jgi:hypothetical protein
VISPYIHMLLYFWHTFQDWEIKWSQYLNPSVGKKTSTYYACLPDIFNSHLWGPLAVRGLVGIKMPKAILLLLVHFSQVFLSLWEKIWNFRKNADDIWNKKLTWDTMSGA